MWVLQDLGKICAVFGVEAWWNISNDLTHMCEQPEETQ